MCYVASDYMHGFLHESCPVALVYREDAKEQRCGKGTSLVSDPRLALSRCRAILKDPQAQG